MASAPNAPLPRGYVSNPGFTNPAQIPPVYAARGSGTCMEPLIPHDTLLIFDSSQEAIAGDFVGIWLRPGCVAPGSPQRLFKRLMWLPPADLPADVESFIVAEMLNPPRRLRFRKSDVIAIHRCIGIGETDSSGRICIAEEFAITGNSSENARELRET